MKAKAILILTIISLITCSFISAQQVEEKTARKAAENWYRHYAPEHKKSATVARVSGYKHNERTAFYIYNFDEGGFVMVSANEAVTPVLGYGFEHAAPDEISNEAVKSWLDNYARQIDTAFVLNLKNEAMTTKWSEVLENRFPAKSGNSVGPLLTTTWDQGWPYNILSPQLPAGSGNNVPAGCTPTAVAQVMKYWNYPEIGIGYNEYAWQDQTMAAFFNIQEYHMESMPDYLSQPDSSVAYLLYQAGVASSTDFQLNGSGAYLSQARKGLIEHFDYSSSMEYILKWTGISDDDWKSMIKNNLDVSKPIIYEGYGSGGHAWVCDGYNDADYFHMNWGWGGQYNGLYYLDNLNLGWISFNGFHGAIFNIEPQNSPLKADFIAKITNTTYQKQFIDFSKGNPLTRVWDFGDGYFAEQINPIHQYDTAGLYNVKLIVSDGVSFDTIQKIIRVNFPYFSDIDLSFISGVESVGDFSFGDYDNDGDMDAIIQYLGYIHGNRNYYTRSIRNDSLNLFSVIDHGFPDVNYGSVSWGDVNNNNTLDLAIVGFDYNLNSLGHLYKNTENSFELYQMFDEYFCYSPATWGDIDNDGDQDFVIKDKHGFGVILYDNIYTYLKFDTIFQMPEWVMDLRVNVSDLNSDGTNNIVLYSKLGDFDNDGDLDGFQRGWFYYQNGEIVSFQNGEIFLNDNGVMTALSYSFPNAVDWGDFDGDGDFDILAANTVYRNDNGVFVDLELDLVNAVAWFDYDNDGDLDIIVSVPGASYSNWKILRNNANPVQLNIPVPLNLTAITNLNEVTINWERAISNFDEGAGFTYNIYIGKSDSTTEILSPMADIVTGYRKVIESGNASANTSWTIKNIPNGNYFFGVQSINAQYKGSMFVNGTFTINGINLLPEIISGETEGFVNIPIQFESSDFENKFFDPEGDSLTKIIITSLPLCGTLKYNGQTVIQDQIISVSNMHLLTYQTNSIADDFFLWKASDRIQNEFSEKAAKYFVKIHPFMLDTLLMLYSMSPSLGDFDGDNDLDLLSGNCLIRNISGIFSDTIFITDEHFRYGHIVDFNSDGLNDLIVANDNIGLIFYRNADNNIFIKESKNIVSVSTPRYAIGDYNNDGYIDIFLTGLFESNTAIEDSYISILYSNDMNGNFIAHQQQFPPVRVGIVKFADLDNNGFSDIILAGEINYNGERIMKIYFNNQEESFTESMQEFEGLSYGSIDVADVDNDGYLDILTCGRAKYQYPGTYTAKTTLYLNSGGVFKQHELFYPSNIHSGQAKFADINMDGRTDVILFGQEYNYGRGRRNVAKLYLNNFPEFIEKDINTPILGDPSFSLGDIENDGDIDILLSGFNALTNQFETLKLTNTYQSNLYTLNQPPTVPENLSHVMEKGRVKLIWDRSTDVTTPQSALTYNVIISPSGEGIQLLSPMINPNDSTRLISKNGNSGNLNFKYLRKQPMGTYLWAVQAIDNSYAASAFSVIDTILFDGSPDIYDSTLFIGPKRFNFGKSLFENVYVDYENDSLSVVKFIKVPDHCNLYKDTLLLQNGAIVNINEINNVYIIPEYGFLGRDSIIWKGSDGDSFSAMSATLVLNIQVFKELSFQLHDLKDPMTWWGNGAPSFGDFNNDNNLDLGINQRHQTAGWYNNTLYKNQEGLLIKSGEYVGGGRNPIHWVDIDGDQDLDYSSSSYFVINMDSIFIEIDQLAWFGTNNFWGDFNGNNIPDFPSRYSIYTNDGNGNFTPNNCFIYNTYYFNHLIWNDLNSNGYQDFILTANSYANCNYLQAFFRNSNDNCDFTWKCLEPIPATFDGSIDFADFDRDNDNDILITGTLQNGEPFSGIFINEGNGFVVSDIILPQLTTGNAKWVDLNNDGFLDVAMFGMDVNNQPKTAIFLNLEGVFVEVFSGIIDLHSGWLDVGDVDNDGFMDLVISGIDVDGSFFSKLYKNLFGSEPRALNAKPGAPVLLSTMVNGNSVEFHWESGGDDTTPDNSLSFNMYLYKENDSLFICSPLADTLNGYRKIVGKGNTSLNKHWRIDSLKSGKYFWSVQAIDNSYIGGPFAIKQAFTICSNPLSAGIIYGDSIIYKVTDSVLYYVDLIDDATSYIWILPPGATGNSTTNSILVNFGTEASSGEISVRGVNACGEGEAASLFIDVIMPLPNNRFLDSETITENQSVCFDAFETITVSNLLVQAGGNLELIAGGSILILPETSVESGGIFRAWITSDSTFCIQPLSVVASDTEVKAPENDEAGIPNIPFFHLFPNPTNSAFTLELTDESITGAITVEIYSMMGERLLQRELAGSRQYVFDLGSRPAGVYLVRVVTDGEMGMGKVVKQ